MAFLPLRETDLGDLVEMKTVESTGRRGSLEQS